MLRTPTISKIACILAAAIISGCQNLNLPMQTGFSPSERVPEYATPKEAFQKADFNVVASEFIDQYAGQYVYFDAMFVMTSPVVQIKPIGGTHKVNISDMKGIALIGKVTDPKYVTAIWSVDDRDIGLPVVSLSNMDPVRVYAYILPPRKPYRYKNRTDKYGLGFGEHAVLLMNIEKK